MDTVPQDHNDRHGLSQMDRVHIKGVAAHGYHGVLAAERAQGQEFSVDVTLFLDTAQAAATDDLDLTVNYAHVCDALVSVVEGHPVNLIETLAERLAAIVLENQLVNGVAVTVHKPRAPIAVPFTDVEVSITRSRSNMPSVARPFVEDQILPVASLPRWSQDLPAPREIPELEEVWAEQVVTSEPVVEDQPAPKVEPELDVVLAPNVALVAPIISNTELPAGVPTWAQVISTGEATPDNAPALSSGPVFSPVADLDFEADPEPEPELPQAAPLETALEGDPEPEPEPEPELEPEPEVERESELEVEPQPDYSDTFGNDDLTQIIPVVTDDAPAPDTDLGAAPIIEPSPESLAIYQALRAQVLGTQDASDAGDLAVPERFEPEGDIMDRVPLTPAHVVIALGANLGAAQETLAAAVVALGEVAGFELVKTGPLARTGAVGGPQDQPDYLNTVVIGLTTLSPRQLLAETQKIENEHGRVRLEHWGPRTLDLDIIDFEGVVATTTDLELPHPRANQRAFVLVPWEVMDPDAYLPGLGGGPVAALAATAPDRPGIRWVALEWLES